MAMGADMMEGMYTEGGKEDRVLKGKEMVCVLAKARLGGFERELLLLFCSVREEIEHRPSHTAPMPQNKQWQQPTNRNAKTTIRSIGLSTTRLRQQTDSSLLFKAHWSHLFICFHSNPCMWVDRRPRHLSHRPKAATIFSQTLGTYAAFLGDQKEWTATLR